MAELLKSKSIIAVIILVLGVGFISASDEGSLEDTSAKVYLNA